MVQREQIQDMVVVEWEMKQLETFCQLTYNGLTQTQGNWLGEKTLFFQLQQHMSN